MTPLLAQRLGTDRSFERLYRKHAGDVYRYALVVLRNQADAEDVTQTTFLNAYRAMERGERPRSPQNWLIAIAHNVCRQRFRQSQRRPSEVAYEEELAESVVEEDAISADDIRRALGHLAFNQRAALVMRELEGRSYQEIADILDLSVSAVETLIFRARRALREQLEEGITCHEAELAISKQLDGRLSRHEKGALRAHLRECKDCAGFARSQRAQRGALKSLGAIPLPPSLGALFGGGGAGAGAGAAVGGGLAVKAAAVGAGALVATGVGYEGAKQTVWRTPASPKAAAPIKQHATPIVSRARGVSTVVVPIAQEPKHDQKPFRGVSVKARALARDRGEAEAHGPGVKPEPLAKPKHEKPVHKEASPLPPSRGRGHDLKPTKPAKPAKPVKQAKHAKSVKTHARPGSRGHGQTQKHKSPAPPPAPPQKPKPKDEKPKHAAPPPPPPPDETATTPTNDHGKSGR